MNEMKTRDSVLLAIDDHQRELGVSPTVREIGDRTHISSTSNIHFHLRRLERHGLLMRHKNKARAIVVTQDGRERIKELRGSRKRIRWGASWPDEPGYWWCRDDDQFSIYVALDDLTVTDGVDAYARNSIQFQGSRWEKVALPTEAGWERMEQEVGE
jgi:SOS-response transcriptional repressor LexA